MAEAIDLTGKRFGKWIVLERAGKDKYRNALWKCKCDCGTYKDVAATSLLRGHSTSCGCTRIEKVKIKNKLNATHGETNTRLYQIWRGMRRRCSDSNFTDYKLYGERGISVCEEWQHYEPFRDWALSHGYSETLTIDRIDVNGDYKPSNCKWATRKEQARNTRYTIYATYHGETKPLIEWAEIIGKKYNTLMQRINKGYSIEQAFEEPLRHH